MTNACGQTDQTVAELNRQLAERDVEIARQSAELKARDLLIEQLKLQLAQLRRHRFGSKSEALDTIIDQLELALEEAEQAAAVSAQKEPDAAPEEKGQAKRKPLPDHLPREDVVLMPGEACSECGGALRTVGEDICETLEYVPGRFKVIRTIRPKLSCRQCETMVQAPAPSTPIERGRLGPALRAHVLVSKYADHLPLYRQSQIYAREHVDLERSTLADSVGRSTALLEPLGEAISRHVMAGAAIHADDTPVNVLAPGTGKTKTGRMWVYVRDERDWLGDPHPAAVYHFTPDRKGRWPKDHLKDYSGWLHADGYAGFEELYRSNRIKEVACLAHIRRTFSHDHLSSGNAIISRPTRKRRLGRAIKLDQGTEHRAYRRLIILSFGDRNPMKSMRRRAASIFDLKCLDRLLLTCRRVPSTGPDALTADLAAKI